MSRFLIILGLCGAFGCQHLETQANPAGQQLFTTACARCHGPAAEGDETTGAPALAGLRSAYIATQLQQFKNGPRGTAHNDDRGREMRGIARIYLSGDRAIAAVADYLSTLPARSSPPTITGDRVRGAAYYAACAPCHGEDAAGREELAAPALRAQHDWYLAKQLRAYRDGTRGAAPSHLPGISMQAAIATLPDEQAIHDVLSYIASLNRD